MKTLMKIATHPTTPAALGIANLILSNGNVWMVVTGATLIAISVLDWLDR